LPVKVRTWIDKSGSSVAADAEAIGHLVTIILTADCPTWPRRKRMEQIVEHLFVETSDSIGFGPNRVASMPHAIGIILGQYLKTEEE